MVAGEYQVVWTPDFTEDVSLAVDYVQNVLKIPIAAKNLLEGIEKTLENRKAMPTAAVKRATPNGAVVYMASYHHYNVYYTIEDNVIKAIALKHQLEI